MTFFANFGYQFRDPGAPVGGGMILARAMPMHSLIRRKVTGAFLAQRLFDPQLYMAGINAASATKEATNLASYPWFGVPGLDEYDSGLVKQKDWKRNVQGDIGSKWPSSTLSDPSQIRQALRACIQFQIELECEAIILPSPLCAPSDLSLTEQILWLDLGLEIANELDVSLPVYTTLALSDVVVSLSAPQKNEFLDLALDAIGARESDGVYLVLEQGLEGDATRDPSNLRVLESILYLVSGFATGTGKTVGVNFLGPFGIACRGAGADWVCSGWYKSLYRFRLGDVGGSTGRAYPTYWSASALAHVHLATDLDALANSTHWRAVQTNTRSAAPLHLAFSSAKKVKDVPAWQYRQSNIQGARQHFYQAMCELEAAISTNSDPRGWAREWLASAAKLAQHLPANLGAQPKTTLAHVGAWWGAFDAWDGYA